MENIHNKNRHFFAAANTSQGFKSCFSETFNMKTLDKLYILKGGPGCGKSTFMKNTAKMCENQGLSVECYRCSSDPDSLDAIVINELKIAIVDGTSPHSVEPCLAGAFEEIIDLGKAWDTKELFHKRQELEKLSSQKKECYKNAYNLLYVSKEIKNILSKMVSPCLKNDKISLCAKRLVKSISPKNSSDNNIEKISLVNAISCKGKIHLCTFEDEAKKCIFVKEEKHNLGVSGIFLGKLYEEAKKKGTELRVSFSPFDMSVVDGVFFVKEKVSVTLYNQELVSLCDKTGKNCRIINVSRFLDAEKMSETKKERKFYEKLCENLEDKALQQLEKAGNIHFSLEKIYSSCTNYRVVEKMYKDFEKTLMKEQISLR